MSAVHKKTEGQKDCQVLDQQDCCSVAPNPPPRGSAPRQLTKPGMPPDGARASSVRRPWPFFSFFVRAGARDVWSLQLSLDRLCVHAWLNQCLLDSRTRPPFDLSGHVGCQSMMPGRERERESFTPFQPHRADAGAAGTFPGGSQSQCQCTVGNNAKETRTDTKAKDRA